MNTLIRNARAIYCAPESHTHHESQISVNHSNPAVPTDIRIRDGVITGIGNQLLPTDDEQVIDASGCVVWPGLVNTHHHLAQSVLKGVPEGLNQALGDWLGSVPYRFWPKISPQLMYHAARLGLYELLRSGATTCADHHYLYHAGSSPEVEDAVWAAADELGIRLVLCRGSATVQGSHKGMLKHGIQPENVELVMQRMERSYRQYHQAGDNAMRRLVVAPTSLVHSATPGDLRTLAAWARERQLKLHSHLLEVSFDDIQAQEKYGQRAIDYAASCDWLGKDVWFAHLVKSDEYTIQQLAASGTGIAHCPTSNCRLGSGIAPALAMEQAGMNITLGVDGSASAESGSMIQELNLAWLLHRAVNGADATSAEQIIRWGSHNGAQLLGLNNCGDIAVGKAADLVLYDIGSPRFAGVHSEVIAPLLCAEPIRVKYSLINGRVVVDNGQVCGLDEAELVAEVRAGVANLLRGTG